MRKHKVLAFLDNLLLQFRPEFGNHDDQNSQRCHEGETEQAADCSQASAGRGFDGNPRPALAIKNDSKEARA